MLHDQHASRAEWVVFQAIESVGLGTFLSNALPAVQAKLSDDDTAKATGVWQFMRSFGMVLGSAIPTTIFNSAFDELADAISEPSFRSQLVERRKRPFYNRFPMRMVSAIRSSRPLLRR
jgi:hypothetical protein